MSTTLAVTVKDKTGTLFEGAVIGVTSCNEKGIFDILPEHEQFITLINNELTLHHEYGKKHTMPLTHGILRVEKNTVEIYLGI